MNSIGPVCTKLFHQRSTLARAKRQWIDDVIGRFGGPWTRSSATHSYGNASIVSWTGGTRTQFGGALDRSSAPADNLNM
jgi:hypothetical protein